MTHNVPVLERPYARLSASRPQRRERFIKWRSRAEELAKLPQLARIGWHSLRRKFTTELKHIPLTDLCELGSWKTAEMASRVIHKPIRARCGVPCLIAGIIDGKREPWRPIG